MQFVLRATDSKDEYVKKSTNSLKTMTEIYQDISQELKLNDKSEISVEILEKTVGLLKEKADGGDSEAAFLLGQLYFEEGRYAEAEMIFDGIKDQDPRALYQLAVIYYDGLHTKEDFGRAIEYMRRVAFWDSSDVGSIRFAALYNLGRAYLEGCGVQASSIEAERFWLLAADDGNPNANVKAQSALGMFYCRPETLNLRKVSDISVLLALSGLWKRQSGVPGRSGCDVSLWIWSTEGSRSCSVLSEGGCREGERLRTGTPDRLLLPPKTLLKSGQSGGKGEQI
ncbi:LRP2-binding protein isoform X3 [Misgurnus anguillicaudatus]|uniref:LRP2-binding protein isoform X3 n=1 Tax=Misgurnus anguillicaudatus TaxID=75329 RepID=UPI003CCF9348